MDFLKKIQSLNIKTRKIILWSITILLGIIFLMVWIKITSLRFQGFNDSGAFNQIKKPNIEIPSINMPNFFELFPTLPNDSSNLN